ncbi:MAG TPA: DUF1152 domain-containing protein [Actinomycetota bacterium]|nr:DUF1152 domain-containing protein [Actinomycetota bacterium]
MTDVTLESAARRATSAVIVGNGGGGDCLVTVLVASWLRTMGVGRTLVGGIACQWWLDAGVERGELVEVIGPDLYDPRELDGARSVGEHAVLVGPDAASHGRRPHEAVLAEWAGGEAFVLSLLGGARGTAAGLSALVEHASADLVIAIDVGSDCLSTGREVRPAMTVLADHLTFAGLLAQRVPSFFCLAGFGVDAEMEVEELTTNFGLVVRAGGLRGAFVPDAPAVGELEALQAKAYDPVGNLVVKAVRGEFGLHRVHTGGPWGQVARIGPAAIPVWALDPRTVLDQVASDVRRIVDTASLAEAEAVYRELGRLPESGMVRVVDFRRRPEA